jgi:hypothetical protein
MSLGSSVTEKVRRNYVQQTGRGSLAASDLYLFTCILWIGGPILKTAFGSSVPSAAGIRIIFWQIRSRRPEYKRSMTGAIDPPHILSITKLVVKPGKMTALVNIEAERA